MPLTRSIVLVFFLITGAVSGCSGVFKALPLSRSEAEKRLVEICKKEYTFDIVTRTVDNTAWAYLPIEHPILSTSAADTASTSEQPRKFSILFIDGRWKDGTFLLEYDIVPSTKASAAAGYTNQYTEQYRKKQYSLMLALLQSYGEADATGSAGGEKPPDFFVVIIADIKSGIETRETFYFKDFRYYMSGMLSPDEYARRYLSDVQGDRKIVGDIIGRHLEYRAITWPEFLTRQIVHRVQFKYQQSAVQPEDTAFAEITRIIGEAVRAYNFTDFESVELKDLRSGQEYLLTKSQILAAAQ